MICDECVHKIEMSESELYCAESQWGTGEIFDWCDKYNYSKDYILTKEPNMKNCEGFKGGKK